jgi:hypothetical protein
MNVAKGVMADTRRLRDMVASGNLQLGLVANVTGRARNIAGYSDENSVRLADFDAGLEKLRNDILLLHKGVQTEGDAQRAMKQIIASRNDPKVAQAQLNKLMELNARAAQDRLDEFNSIQSNYGLPTVRAARATPTTGAAPGGEWGAAKVVGD